MSLATPDVCSRIRPATLTAKSKIRATSAALSINRSSSGTHKRSRIVRNPDDGNQEHYCVIVCVRYKQADDRDGEGCLLKQSDSRFIQSDAISISNRKPETIDPALLPNAETISDG